MGPVGELDAVTIDCHDPVRLGSFWAAVFGTTAQPSDGEPAHYVDLAPMPGLPTLRFQRVPEGKTVKNRLHLDVAVADLDEATARVEALGGRRLPGRTLSEYGYDWRVLTDPEGNEFCVVIRPA